MHLHEVKDKDTHYIIEPTTMAITNANHVKNKLMQGDHNSEVFTFELPKEIEGHDMSLCDKVELHFINHKADKTEKSADVYVIRDMHVDETETDKLVFTATLDGKATKYAGSLWIRILFACTSEGVYTYKKWTDIFKDIAVGEGFENTEGIIEENSDLLVQWKAELEEKIATACKVKTVNGKEADENGNIDIFIPTKLSQLENDVEKDYYTKQEIDSLLGIHVNEVAELIGGEA